MVTPIGPAIGPIGRYAVAHPDERDRDLEALRERLSRLSEASLRINESLDFDQVLQGVLDAARSLTAARHGLMTLLDERGGVRDSLASGLSAAEAERVWSTPEGLRIFQSLTDLSEPLRLPDLEAHMHRLGFGGFTIPLPVGVLRFLAAPMQHRGARVGHVFVGGKEGGGEFSRATYFFEGGRSLPPFCGLSSSHSSGRSSSPRDCQ